MADFNTDSSSLGQIDATQARELAISEQRGAPSGGPSKFAVAMDALLPAGLTFAQMKAPQVMNVALTTGAGAMMGGGQAGAMGGTGSPMFGGSGAGKFMTGSNIPAPPAPPGGGGMPGMGGLGAPPPPPGGGMPGMAGGAMPGAGADQFGGQIDAMFNNNVTFLMLQTKVQNMSQQFQAVSNIVKADHDARTNAIRNFRS